MQVLFPSASFFAALFLSFLFLFRGFFFLSKGFFFLEFLAGLWDASVLNRLGAWLFAS
jgi:hypothetical protein